MLKHTLVIKKRHAILNKNGKPTGKYALSVECISGTTENVEIEVCEDINIIKVQGFGKLKRYYDEPHMNIKSYSAFVRHFKTGKYFTKEAFVEEYIEGIELDGHRVFEIGWCYALETPETMYKKEGEDEWREASAFFA